MISKIFDEIEPNLKYAIVVPNNRIFTIVCSKLNKLFEEYEESASKIDAEPKKSKKAITVLLTKDFKLDYDIIYKIRCMGEYMVEYIKYDRRNNHIK